MPKLRRSYRKVYGGRYKKARRTALPVSQLMASSTCKKIAHEIPFSTFSGSLLQDLHLSAISQGTSVNQRERQMINIKGIKLTEFSQVISTNVQGAWARTLVVRSKYSASEEGTTELETDLFRGTNQRAINYQGTKGGSHKCFFPINTDKWEVFYDKTVYLNSGTQPQPDTRMSKDIWIPVNRRINYDGTASTNVQGGLYLIFFHDSPAYSGTVVDTDTTHSISRRLDAIVYYHDVL